MAKNNTCGWLPKSFLVDLIHLQEKLVKGLSFRILTGSRSQLCVSISWSQNWQGVQLGHLQHARTRIRVYVSHSRLMSTLTRQGQILICPYYIKNGMQVPGLIGALFSIFSPGLLWSTLMTTNQNLPWQQNPAIVQYWECNNVVKESGPTPRTTSAQPREKNLIVLKPVIQRCGLSSPSDWPRGVHVTKFWPMRCNTKNTARASGKDFAP